MAGCRLTLPRDVLLGALPALMADGAAPLAWGMAARAGRLRGDEFILSRLAPGTADGIAKAQDNRHQVPFVLRFGKAWDNPAAWAEWLSASGIAVEGRSIGFVALDGETRATGWVLEANGWSPIAEFCWPGNGMARAGVRDTPPADDDDSESDDANGRDSRLAGALTPQGLARLRSMSYAVIGVSRVGSLVAHTLMRWGVRRILLVDPDRVEPHNADAGEFHPAFDEGSEKVEAVARTLRPLLRPGASIDVYANTLATPMPYSACRSADCLITCVDDDGARLQAAALAASYLRLHLDIGTQVFRQDDGSLQVGADIRLLVPADRPRCLNCFGGFAQADALRRTAGLDDAPPLPWNALRAGSLRTVNQIAAHAGLRLLERLVTGTLAGSTWLRYEETPLPSLREIVPHRPWTCPLCSTTYGIGDALFDERDLRIRRLARAVLREVPAVERTTPVRLTR